MVKKVTKSGAGMGIGLWLGIAAVVAVLGGGLYLGLTTESPGEKMPSQGNAHIKSLNDPINPPYNSNPPTSGPHTDARPYFKIYDEFLPNQLQVHGLEDGGVIIHYHPEKASQEHVQKLKDLLPRLFPGRNARVPQDTLDHVILQPNPSIETAWALTAWTRIDKFDAYDEARILRFVRAYKGIDNHP